jgi:hypothetical protein
VRRRRKKTKNIVLNKFKLGITLTVLGGLFFFSLLFAASSPVLGFFTNYASIPFGAIGLYIFFALCFLVGIIIMAKGYLMKLLIRQFFLVMIVVSAILNFPIIDGAETKYEQFG